MHAVLGTMCSFVVFIYSPLLTFWKVSFIFAMQCSAHYAYSIDCVMDTEILGNLVYCVIFVIVVIVTKMRSHAWADSYSLHDGYSFFTY